MVMLIADGSIYPDLDEKISNTYLSVSVFVPNGPASKGVSAA